MNVNLVTVCGHNTTMLRHMLNHYKYIVDNNLKPDSKLFGFKDTADYNKFIEHIAKKSGADIMVYDVQEGRFIEFGKQKETVLGV